MGQGDDAVAAQNIAKSAGAGNISLVEKSASAQLPLEDESADFIYSLHGVIKLQDLSSFKALVAECSRVLRPGGVAMLWFGRLSRLPFALPNRAWLRGYELRTDPESGEQTLNLRMYHAMRTVHRAGMRTPSLSTPLHPDTSWRLFRAGAMSYVTAWKRQ